MQRSPTPKTYSNEPTFIKEDAQVDLTEQYIEEMKKGTSNILVPNLCFHDFIGRCASKAFVAQRDRER